MGVSIQTIKDIKHYLAKELEKIYPEQEITAIAGIVTGYVTGYSRLYQLGNPQQTITIEQSARIIAICNELKTGRPIQYIIGETVFYDCIIKVNSSVLIPRPETEELVDFIIKENTGFKGHIIDIGTGTGCIAIALAVNLPGAFVTATDISDEAISLAFENAVLNMAKVRFLKNDILSSIPELNEEADIIVSNPPYVLNSQRQIMDINVLEFEPHLALFVDDTDPLIFYRAILRSAEKILRPDGKIYLEINEVLGNETAALLESFRYTHIDKIADINGRDRIISGIKYDR